MSDPYEQVSAQADAEFAAFTGAIQGAGVDAARVWVAM